MLFWCNSNGIPHVVRYLSDIRNMFDIPNISKHAKLDISRHSRHDLRLLELRILKAKSTGMRDKVINKWMQSIISVRRQWEPTRRDG